MATLVDVHASDKLVEGCYQQNSDLFKPWRPVATIQGRDAVPSLSHPLRTPSFLPYPEVVGSNPETPEKNFTSNLLQENSS